MRTKAPSKSIARKSVAQNPAGKARVVRGVIHGVLQGHWKGGDRLTETEAAVKFDVSRTPVREALLELAAMGVVELRRNCGAVFRPFGPKELLELYAVRSLLEVEAARLAATRIESQVVVRLKGEFEMLKRAGRPDANWRLDRELHAAIAGATGNPRLASEIARYADLVQTTREAVGKILTDVHSASVSEHLEILRALEKRDPEAAARAMSKHLEQAADSAARALTNVRVKRRR